MPIAYNGHATATWSRGEGGTPLAKIIEIEGIGEVFAAKLEGAGVPTVEALLKQGGTPGGRKALAEKTELSTDRILEWVNRADLMRIKGVAPSTPTA